MSRAIMESEVGGSEGNCAISRSLGVREIINECMEVPGVFWDLTSDGPFNWEIPVFNITGDQVILGDQDITGDQVRLGNERIEGYKEFININTPSSASNPIVYSNSNELYAKLPNGNVWRLAPPDHRLVSLANRYIDILNLLG